MSVALSSSLAKKKPNRNPLIRGLRKLARTIQNSIEVGNFMPDGTKNVAVYLRYPGASPAGRWFATMLWSQATQRMTRAGHWFFYFTLFLGIFAAVSLEVQIYVPFIYACAFWGVTTIYAMVSKPNVSLRSRHTGVVSAGELIAVDVDVTSTRRGGLFPAQDLNIVPIGLPAEVDSVPLSGVALGTLDPGATVRVRMLLKAKKRGVFTLPGFRVDSDFPFGLLNAYRRIDQPSALTVYPIFTPLTDFTLPSGTRNQEGGVAMLAKQGDSFEFWGNREWREGDSQRDIDWRATARLGGMTPIVREWREEYFFRVGIVLDSYLPRPTGEWRRALYGRRGLMPSLEWRAAFERAVSISASVSDYMAREQYVIDIFAAGPTLHHLTVGRGVGYRDEILNILAGLDDTDREPLTEIEPELLASITRLTTVICVFLQYDDRRRQFVELLRSTGVGVKVIVVPPGEVSADDDDNMPVGVIAAPEADTVIVNARTFEFGVNAL